ncbi:protein EMSY-LIKE 3-like [Cornus florida]|uniref:protein EMSY-LIKE 3-like n=1 Tax=Cornus florida TaxID=4283 RepID=UPI002898D8F1|nr:protein EMSY-LIKE 3-like [Cornus florida]
MDFTNHDGIGAHINLPLQHINNSLWVHSHMNGRMTLRTESHGMDAMDVNSKIHCIEIEAYGAVLRAFITQSDVLSWGKEGLLTELRKELNVADHEHQKLLARIDSDESVRIIREWRKGTSHAQESVSSKMNAPGYISSSLGNVAHKISKTSHAAASLQKYVSHGQSTSASIPSSLPVQFMDGQWTRELPMPSTGSTGQSMNYLVHGIPVLAVSNRRGLVKAQLKKGFDRADVGKFKKKSDKIEIRATDKLIYEVERMVYGRGDPDPVCIEKAKSILREHEKAILDALKKLSDVSDGDDSYNQLHHHYSLEELHRIEQGTVTRNFYGQIH